MNTSEIILSKIKKEEIRPISKWNFIAKEYLIWGLLLIGIILGSLSTSVVIYYLTDSDWDVYKYLDMNLFEWVLLNLPYFWIIFLVLFTVFALFLFRKTKTGYKFSTSLIIFITIIASVLLGIVFSFLGFGNYIDNILSDNLPFYRNISHMQTMWMNPDEGLLVGEIISVNSNNSFVIKDLNGKSWNITGNGISWRGQTTPNVGVSIKIIGSKTSDSSFEATEIRPMNGNMGGGMGRNMMGY
jgi:hypothetical protein